MQKPDWKDFRQALKDNNGSVAGAKTTLGKKFLQKDIDAAQREYDAQNFNEQVDEAMKKAAEDYPQLRGYYPKAKKIQFSYSN